MPHLWLGCPADKGKGFFVGTKTSMPKFVPPEPIGGQPVAAKQAIGDLEALHEDKGFSRIWSLANASGEQGNRQPAYLWTIPHRYGVTDVRKTHA